MRRSRPRVVAAGVVEGTLQAAVDAADGEPVGLVEKVDGALVLQLAVLDDGGVVGPVGVDGQAGPSGVLARVAEEPVEAVLTLRRGAEDLLAEVDDVVLVAVCSAYGPGG